MSTKHHAFTLLELLVVLALISLLALGAVNVMDSTDDQKRFERTREQYGILNTAIFGPALSGAEEMPWITGSFVSDMGRLPNSINELLVRPVNAPPFIPNLTNRGVVVIPGWRGPYLDSYFSSKDSWGHPWLLQPPQPGVSPPPPFRLGSYGKDGLPGGAVGSYEQDFPVNLEIINSGFSASQKTFRIPYMKFKLPKSYNIDEAKWEEDKENYYELRIGVLYPSLNLTDTFSEIHPSLVKNPDGSPLIKYAGKKPESKKQKHDEIGKEDDLIVTLPPLVYQCQIAVYLVSMPGNTLADKLIAAHPHVLYFMPRSTPNVPQEFRPKDWVLRELIGKPGIKR